LLQVMPQARVPVTIRELAQDAIGFIEEQEIGHGLGACFLGLKCPEAM